MPHTTSASLRYNRLSCLLGSHTEALPWQQPVTEKGIFEGRLVPCEMKWAGRSKRMCGEPSTRGSRSPHVEEMDMADARDFVALFALLQAEEPVPIAAYRLRPTAGSFG